jgi:hypothetical protein
MNREEIAAVKEAFDSSLEPLWKELRTINETLGGEGGVVQVLREHSQILNSIDTRLTHVEGILNGVEILVRKAV